jgi:hypothetical protein
MMSRGFITKAEVIGPGEDEDTRHVDLKITDNEESDDELFIVEIEIGDGDTILLNEANAAALTEALGEILKRYGYEFLLMKYSV